MKFFALSTLFIIILTIPSFADTSHTVDFKAYQKRVQTRLPEWQEQTLNIKRSKIAVQKAQAYLNPQLSATVNGSSGPGSSSGTTTINQQSGVVANVAIQQTLPVGIRLKGSMDYSHIEMNGTNIMMKGLDMSTGSFKYTTNDFSTISDSPSLSLQMTIPLLKNLGGTLDVYAFKNAKLQQQISELNARISRRNLANIYAKSYYQWIYQHRLFRYLQESLTNSSLQENQMMDQLKDGLIDKDQFVSSTIQRLSIEEQIRQGQNNLANLQNMLFSVLENGETPDSKSWPKTLEKVLQNKPTPVPFEKTDTAKVLTYNIKTLKLSLQLLQNQALPNLNLTGNVSVKSDSSTNGVGDAFAHLNQAEGYVGLQFSYPLGNTSANAQIEDTKIAIEKLNLTLTKQKRDYEQNLNNLIEKISFYQDSIRLKEESLKQLNTKYKEQQKKYSQGRLTFFELISTESSMLSSQISLIGNEYNLIAATLDYTSLTGETF